MATDLTPEPISRTVDLTGLPEPVAQDIRRLVQTLREKLHPYSGPLQQSSSELLADRHVQTAAPEPGHDAGRPLPVFLTNPRPSAEEFRRLLDELASRPSETVLPPDFSRADIYDDHD
jgi:hypothetical protein